MRARTLAVARWIAIAYLLSLPVQAWPLATLRGQPVLLPDALLVATWAAAAVALVAARGAGLREVARWVVAGSAFLAVLALSAVVGGKPPSSFLKLAAFAPMVLVPALLRWLFPDRSSALRAIKAFAAGCALALAVGLATIALFYIHRPVAEESLMCGYGALHRAGYPRLCAPFRNFNMFADYLVATLPLAAVFVEQRLGRWAAFGLVGIASVVTLFTLSAGIGAFALVVAFVVGPLFGEARVGKLLRGITWVGAILVELAFIAASLGTLVDRGAGTFPLGSHDYLWWDGSRPAILGAGLRTWLSHPFLGVGYGSTVAHVTDPRAFVPADKIIPGQYAPFADMEAHDLLLSVAGQAGILGLVVFVTTLVVLVTPLVRARLAEADRRLRGVTLASVAAVVVVHGVFIAVEEARHFWPLLAMPLLVACLATRESASA